MSSYEYRAIPAPNTGTKAKGVKTTEDRFALSLTDALNDMAAEGWEYLRAETLPCEVRKGLRGRETVQQSMLIFRRSTGPSPLQSIVETRDPLPPLTLEDPFHTGAAEDSPKLGPATRD